MIPQRATHSLLKRWNLNVPGSQVIDEAACAILDELGRALNAEALLEQDVGKDDLHLDNPGGEDLGVDVSLGLALGAEGIRLDPVGHGSLPDGVLLADLGMIVSNTGHFQWAKASVRRVCIDVVQMQNIHPLF